MVFVCLSELFQFAHVSNHWNLQILLNPLYVPGSRIPSSHFDTKVRALARKYLWGRLVVVRRQELGRCMYANMEKGLHFFEIHSWIRMWLDPAFCLWWFPFCHPVKDSSFKSPFRTINESCVPCQILVSQCLWSGLNVLFLFNFANGVVWINTFYFLENRRNKIFGRMLHIVIALFSISCSISWLPLCWLLHSLHSVRSRGLENNVTVI